MNCDLPSPAVCLLRREARVVMPSLVEELDRTICQSAPRERGDRIDHHPKFIFGWLQFIERPVGFRPSWVLLGRTGNSLPGRRDCKCVRNEIGFRGGHEVSSPIRFRTTHDCFVLRPEFSPDLNSPSSPARTFGSNGLRRICPASGIKYGGT